jgi:hypothetical protein
VDSFAVSCCVDGRDAGVKKLDVLRALDKVRYEHYIDDSSSIYNAGGNVVSVPYHCCEQAYYQRFDGTR